MYRNDWSVNLFVNETQFTTMPLKSELSCIEFIKHFYFPGLLGGINLVETLNYLKNCQPQEIRNRVRNALSLSLQLRMVIYCNTTISLICKQQILNLIQTKLDTGMQSSKLDWGTCLRNFFLDGNSVNKFSQTSLSTRVHFGSLQQAAIAAHVLYI